MTTKTKPAGTMAEVEIDYTKKEIKLNPVHKPKSEWDRINFIFTVYCYHLGCILFALSLAISKPENFNYFIFYLAPLLTLVFGLIMTLYHYVNPSYADRFFAILATSFHKNRVCIFTVDIIKSKHFLVYPVDFKNVYLKYECSQDFSNIQKIKVIKISTDGSFKNMNSYWGILFEFNQIPRKGEIRLEYI